MSVVINRSEAAILGSDLSRAPSPPPPRVYDDGPLPIRASDVAPRNARIVNRTFDGGKVAFELKIGETVLEDVGLEEVLDYVSAYHLEEYENEEFKKEGELQRIADEEDQRLREEQLARRKERAKRKGVAFLQERSDDDSEDEMEVEVNTGKHGRARPSYKQLFKQPKQRRRRRKRDPVTQELMSLSEDDGDESIGVAEQQSFSEEHVQAHGKKVKQRRRRRKRNPVTGELMPLSESDGDDQSEVSDQRYFSNDRSQERHNSGDLQYDNMGLPKRRRRKRDPVTGELMPLESQTPAPQTSGAQRDESRSQRSPSPYHMSEKPKRNRRRRHPITKELMPLGWVYDPREEQRAQQKGLAVPSIQRLSLTKESEPKRRRLESDSPHRGSGSHRKPGTTMAPVSAFKQGAVIHMGESDSDGSSEDEIQVADASKPKLLRRSIGGAPIVAIPSNKEIDLSPGRSKVTALSVRSTPSKASRARLPSESSESSIIPLQVEDQASSSEDDEDEEDHAPAPSAPVTSIMHPSARALESSESESEDENDDEDLPDDEYFVEAILEHAWSNPQTHPAQFGKKPVMLYKVKWEGFDAPTWEPTSSFGGMDVVSEYQRKAGMTEQEING